MKKIFPNLNISDAEIKITSLLGRTGLEQRLLILPSSISLGDGLVQGLVVSLRLVSLRAGLVPLVATSLTSVSLSEMSNTGFSCLTESLLTAGLITPTELVPLSSRVSK